jgi:hypothetical protein
MSQYEYYSTFIEYLLCTAVHSSFSVIPCAAYNGKK